MQEKMTTHLSFSIPKASNEIHKNIVTLKRRTSHCKNTVKIRELSIQIYKKLIAMELGHDVTFDEFLYSHIRKHILKKYYCYSNLFKN
jgi:hypothetical protein